MCLIDAMTNRYIIPATPDHLTDLQHISRQTFVEAFAADNSEENMRHYLEERLSAAQLSTELSNPDSAFFFVLDEDAIAGYLKLNFNTAQTEPMGNTHVEIERIYVLRAFYGKQMGQALLEQAFQTARESNASFIWLGVWEHNYRALRFYEKNGFVAFDRHPFILGDDVQTDILMKREL
ncbi:GNAT family N-acetyltransferase [Rurimicrobium arvi]|uniref:GNAT family N-acetyltransferase n=2 Tax=Rurimicrobium arvi TaxID=2049916 RepID=A0ABP8MLR8_9BACT